MELAVDITDKAVFEIKKIISKKNIPTDYGLRIGVRGAGCAGISYFLGFDKKKENDDEFLFKGISIYIQKKQLMYLMGLKIDFYEGSEARGFAFVDPKLDEKVQ